MNLYWKKRWEKKRERDRAISKGKLVFTGKEMHREINKNLNNTM